MLSDIKESGWRNGEVDSVHHAYGATPFSLTTPTARAFRRRSRLRSPIFPHSMPLFGKEAAEAIGDGNQTIRYGTVSYTHLTLPTIYSV